MHIERKNSKEQRQYSCYVLEIILTSLIFQINRNIWSNFISERIYYFRNILKAKPIIFSKSTIFLYDYCNGKKITHRSKHINRCSVFFFFFPFHYKMWIFPFSKLVQDLEILIKTMKIFMIYFTISIKWDFFFNVLENLILMTFFLLANWTT